MKSALRISILIDNPKSWAVASADTITEQLRRQGHTITRIARAEDIPKGDCAFFFSVEQVIKKEFLSRNAHNIVIHASELPKGKGWSPLTWQIIEGKNEVILTLFEAVERVDSGEIYDQEKIVFDGTELLDEIHQKESAAIVRLALRFIDEYPPKNGRPQTGKSTYYRRRTIADSEIDPDKTLVELFDQLRTVDNEKYPAFFRHRGKTYVIKIYKKD